MIAALTADAVVGDSTSYVAWLDEQRAVDTDRRIGTCGYCMGGPFAVRTAAASLARVGAAASFHGGGLVTDAADSPHRQLQLSNASYLIAIARGDDARAPTDKDALRAAADEAGRPAEIEVYLAEHGWCTIDSPVYDKVQADRAWGRMLELFKGL
jgi:carboxymethylenebutenolidase